MAPKKSNGIHPHHSSTDKALDMAVQSSLESLHEEFDQLIQTEFRLHIERERQRFIHARLKRIKDLDHFAYMEIQQSDLIEELDICINSVSTNKSSQ